MFERLSNHSAPQKESQSDVVASVPETSHESERLFTAVEQLSAPPGIKSLLFFCLTEVQQLPDTTARKKLLYWHLQSITSEAMKLPVTHLGYDIVQTDATITLQDARYVRSDLLSVCQTSVDTAITATQKARFTKELGQVERQLEYLRVCLTTPELCVAAPKALQQTAEAKSDALTQQIEQGLLKKNWKYSTMLVHPDAATKLKLPFPSQVLAGPKLLYCMPSTTIHEGGLSVLVIAQPAFIPSENRFVLLHDQFMGALSAQKLGKILRQANPQHKQAKESTEDQEAQLMDQLVELPEKYQLLPAQSVFAEINVQNSLYLEIQQWLKRHKLSRTDQSIELFAEYVLQILQDEGVTDFKSTQQLTHTQLGCIAQALEHIVVKGLVGKEKLTKKKLSKLTTHYKEHKSEETSAFMQSAGLVLPAANRAINLSGLDCLIGMVGPNSLLLQANPSLLSALHSNTLSMQQLSAVIGKERAQLWTPGYCRNSHCEYSSQETMVGECSVCLLCELDPTRLEGVSSAAEKNSADQQNTSANSDDGLLPHIDLTRFINNDVHKPDFLVANLFSQLLA